MIRRMYINGSDVQVGLKEAHQGEGEVGGRGGWRICQLKAGTPCLSGPAPHVPEQPRWPGSGLGGREPVLVRQGSRHHRGVEAERGVPDRPGEQRLEGAARRGGGRALWVSVNK